MVETVGQGVPIEKVENTENTLQKPEKKFWKDETHLQQIKKNEAQERHDEEIAMNIKLLNSEFKKIDPKLEVSYQGDNKYSLLYPDTKNPNQYFGLVDNFEIKDALDPSSAGIVFLKMIDQFKKKNFDEQSPIPDGIKIGLDTISIIKHKNYMEGIHNIMPVLKDMLEEKGLDKTTAEKIERGIVLKEANNKNKEIINKLIKLFRDRLIQSQQKQ